MSIEEQLRGVLISRCDHCGHTAVTRSMETLPDWWVQLCLSCIKEREQALPQQHQSPNAGTFVPVPVASITPGAIILWCGIGCKVETVTPIDSDHISMTFHYNGQVIGDAFAVDSTIHVWKVM